MVGLILKRQAQSAREAARVVVEWLDRHGHRAIGEPTDAAVLGIEAAVKQEIFDRSEAIVVLGGDGTLLATARLAGPREVPIVGVNLGALGFLTEITTDTMIDGLERTLAGTAAIDRRRMLCAKVRREDGTVETHQALNDVVLSRGSVGRTIDIEVKVDGSFVGLFKADGVIIATPTGSSAYSLSAGGPLVHPSVRVVVLAPICPHTLSVRPIVLGDEALIELRARSRGEQLLLTLDGQEAVALAEDECVEVARSPHVACLVRSPDLGYYDLLRTKLGWAR